MTTATQADLSALYGPIEMETETTRVPLRKIERVYARSSAELRASLNARGQLQPVILNDIGHAEYAVVDGRRRIHAARLLQWDDITAFVIEVDSLVESSLAITANAVRSDNPLSDFEAIIQLSEEGYTEQQIAEATGLRIGTIRKRLKLLDLPQELYAGVLDGGIAVGIAERIASRPDSVQEALVGVLMQKGRITGADMREASSVARDAAANELASLFAPVEPVAPRDHMRQVEDEIRSILKPYVGKISDLEADRVFNHAWKRAKGEIT